MYSGYLKHFVHYGVGCSQKSNLLEGRYKQIRLFHNQIIISTDDRDLCAHTMQINCDITHIMSYLINIQHFLLKHFLLSNSKRDCSSTLHYFSEINRLYYKNKYFMDHVE